MTDLAFSYCIYTQDVTLLYLLFFGWFKVERRDYFQLLIEARGDNVEIENEFEKVEVEKHNFEKKMSFEVK